MKTISEIREVLLKYEDHQKQTVIIMHNKDFYKWALSSGNSGDDLELIAGELATKYPNSTVEEILMLKMFEQ